MINLSTSIYVTSNLKSIIKKVPIDLYKKINMIENSKFTLSKFIKGNKKKLIRPLSFISKNYFSFPHFERINLAADDSIIELLSFLRKLSICSISELRSNDSYYIDQYIELIRFRDYEKFLELREMKNKKQDRIFYFSELNAFLERNKTFCEIFVPNFVSYTEDEMRTQKNFKKYCDKIFINIDNYNSKISEIFSYDEFANDYRMKILKELKEKISVCPYCNLSVVHTAEKKSEWDFDHFYSKSKYPLFACSFGNFVPSCKNCNQTYKNANMIEILNPREDGFSPHVIFSLKQNEIMPISDMQKMVNSKKNKDYFEIKLEKNPGLNTDPEKLYKINNSKKIFDLCGRYNEFDHLAEAIDFMVDIQEYYNAPLISEYKDIVPNVYAKFLKCSDRIQAENLCLNRRLFRMKLDILEDISSSLDVNNQVL